MMSMDEFKKNFFEIERELQQTDPDIDYLLPPIWNRLTDLLSCDIDLTIQFLDQATEGQVDTAFCVVEDVAQRLDSQEYIDCLYRLCEKYSKKGLLPVVKLAEAFMDEYRMENRRKKVIEALNRKETNSE